jgi:hypothetical protein
MKFKTFNKPLAERVLPERILKQPKVQELLKKKKLQWILVYQDNFTMVVLRDGERFEIGSAKCNPMPDTEMHYQRMMTMMR